MVHAQPPRDRPFSVLVTDDDKGSRDAIASVLINRGFVAQTAESGEDAIDIVRMNTIDLLVFDQNMPRMTGIEAIQQVRAFNAIVPALLVTSDASQDVLRLASLVQVYSVLPKPVNANILLHMLRRALSTVYGQRPTD
jgi:two-component system, response regulator PdtaR